jgi:hypothetical protein
MKIHPRASKQYPIMDLFRALSQEEGYSIADSDDVDVFFTKLSGDFEQAAQNPIFLYGFRTQTMFEYVASSLGKCAVIKTEDAGSVHTEEADLKVPDFRIVLTEGTQFLVEVKNFHQDSPFQQFKANVDYIEGLQKYASTQSL